MPIRHLTASLFSIALAACAGKAEVSEPPGGKAEVTGSPGAVAGSTSQDNSASVAVGGGLTAPGDSSVGSSELGGAAECGEPAATCSTPPGLVEPFSTIDRVYTWVTGKWLFCTGQETWQTAPADAIGIEFTPGSSAPTPAGSTVGGNMYYLVKGPSGPVRGAGFNYQFTYDISPEDTGYQFNVHPAPNSGFWLRLKYSACPRELDTVVFYSTTDSLLIPAN